ncbi:MAG: VOC family protein [Anaerolineae bacterium]|nr:VOC family protein [Anaerolineae bacterium]
MMKHTVSWFELPASDMERAVQFYNTIFGIELKREDFGGVPHGIFERSEEGAVTGAVVFDPDNKPSMTGTRLYLNAEGELDAVLGRVQGAGGKVLLPNTAIAVGRIGIIQDTEGNCVGLFSTQ